MDLSKTTPSRNIVSAPPVDPMSLLIFDLIQQERMPRSIPPMQGELGIRPGRAAPIRQRQAAAEDAATFGVQARNEFKREAGEATRSLAPTQGTPPMNQAPGSMPPGAPLLQAPAGAAGMAPAPSQQNLLAILAALSGKPMGGGPMMPGGPMPGAMPPMMGGR